MERWMRRALALAECGRGFVEPNPMVGAVVLDSAGQLAGEGWHRAFGGPHAEVFALAAAGDRTRGGTLVVTLEPCCHHGKTPPCTDAVLNAGIARVVVATADPFPRVAGGGLARLRSAGVEVSVGLCEVDARALNAPYLKLLRTGRPWVHAKWAMALDGKIATRTGDSKWISGVESRQRVHALRGRMDAVIVGRGTPRGRAGGGAGGGVGVRGTPGSVPPAGHRAGGAGHRVHRRRGQTRRLVRRRRGGSRLTGRRADD
jgi:diaminohydroxyphosphoribosylaminopyrimidine deaminase/5-amino-6-(5-phosphoribosylamino)uracil reductase